VKASLLTPKPTASTPATYSASQPRRSPLRALSAASMQRALTRGFALALLGACGAQSPTSSRRRFRPVWTR
jgi:hypothetical protein